MKIISKILKYKRAILLTVLAMICFTSIMSVGPTYAYLKIIHDDQMVDNNFDVSRQVNPTVSKDYTVNVGAPSCRRGNESAYRECPETQSEIHNEQHTYPEGRQSRAQLHYDTGEIVHRGIFLYS